MMNFVVEGCCGVKGSKEGLIRVSTVYKMTEKKEREVSISKQE